MPVYLFLPPRMSIPTRQQFHAAIESFLQDVHAHASPSCVWTLHTDDKARLFSTLLFLKVHVNFFPFSWGTSFCRQKYQCAATATLFPPQFWTNQIQFKNIATQQQSTCRQDATSTLSTRSYTPQHIGFLFYTSMLTRVVNIST